MLRVYLENCGLRIVEASTGPEALELAKAEGRPDLVVIEMWLPEVDGYEVCRRLRAEEPTRAIPIIAVTSDAWPSALAKASSVGCNAVLAKPSPFEDLHRELFRLLGVPSSESSPILPSEAFPPTRDAVRKRSEREPKNLER